MAVFVKREGGVGGIQLTSIAITTPPAKTAYKAGETFNPAGMVVTATYSNGATAIATGVSFEPSTPLAVGTTSVTIRYSEGGVTKTATQAISVTKTALTVPTQSGSLTYNGGSQSPTWNNYDSSKMTLGGTTSGTNAGGYNATFTLKDTALYEWEGGSTAAQTVQWNIGKAAGSSSINKSSIALGPSKLSDTITVTRSGDGAITAQSSDTSVATVSVSGNVVTVNSVNGKSGSATIAIKVAAGTNYTAPTDKTATVTATFDYSAYTSKPSGTQIQAGISGLSATEIKKCADAIAKNSAINNTTSVCYVDTGSGYYTISIGDQISWTMNGTSYPYRIMGFNHYNKSDGSGKAGILFQMVDCFNTKYPMKSSMTTGDGWDDSNLRTTLNSTLYGYLPSDVRGAISQVTIKTAQDVSTSTIITTDDKLFVPAEVEVFGSTSYAKGGTNEGVWYPWYKANNNTSSRIKKVNGSADSWWERSPYDWNSNYSLSFFCFVISAGTSDFHNAYNSFGAAPCFCF